jgi:RNA polymerase sigma-70 factor (ECF subfamily)
MRDLYERFVIFIQSSFSKENKDDLYNFIWKNYNKKISFYVSNLIPLNHPYFEDLVQDVMLKIYKNLHTFNPVHSFKAWLYRIARNHCIDFIKSKQSEINRYEDLETNKTNDDKNPEEIILKDDLLKKIDQFMSSLEDTDREMAYLRFYENIKYQDISKILDMNINTVKSRIRSIKQRIKEHLKM